MTLIPKIKEESEIIVLHLFYFPSITIPPDHESPKLREDVHKRFIVKVQREAPNHFLNLWKYIMNIKTTHCKA